MIILEGVVDENGQLVLQLPPGSPRGRVEVVVREIAAEDIDTELEALLRDLEGEGLTAEEIVQSPEIGIWADRDDMSDVPAYLENLRQQRRERRLRRD
ncbi:MAG: hypothetical protein OHK0046_33220 [Anaerolineae bacterium]